MGALTEIVVFVASPGDCIDERVRVRDAADAVNEALGVQFDVRIRVTGWEQRQPDLGRPQGQINPLVDTCDVFVGLMNRRWGTPTGTHSSGFLEEFERATNRRDAGSERPKVALWFRALSDDVLSDPGEQLKDVLAFQGRVREERLALFDTYGNPDDLETKLVVYLAHIVASVVRRDGSHDAGSAEAGTEDSPEESFGEEGLDEARRQIAATTSAVTALAGGSDADPSAPFDPDRLVLIALGLNNDSGVRLPVHVANRLYLRRDGLALSVMEDDLWLRTLLADMAKGGSSARVVPGWAVVAPNGVPSVLGQLSGLIGSDDRDVVTGALAVLQMLKARPTTLWPEDDSLDDAIPRWAAAIETAGPAAVAYAESVAGLEDVALLDAVANRTGHEDIAAIRDSLTGDVGQLVTFVADAYSPADWKVAAVAGAMPSLDGEQLKFLAVGRNTPKALRQVALSKLIQLGEADLDVLKTCVTKNTLLDAIFGAVGSGELSADVIEQAVSTIKEDTPRRNLEKRLRSYTAPLGQLLEELHTEKSVTALTAWESLAWSHDPKLVEIAREIFDTDADAVVAAFLDMEDWPARDSVVEFLRSEARAGALKILMSQKAPDRLDVERLLRELERSDRISREDLLPLLIEIADETHVSVLLGNRFESYGETARRLLERALELGGPNVARALLEEKEPEPRLRAAHALAEDPSTPQEELRELLFDQDQNVRVIVAESLGERLTDPEIAALLDSYPRMRDSYFYNVVVTLDWFLYRREPSANEGGPSRASTS